MDLNHLVFRHLLCLMLLSCCSVGCSTKIKISSQGNTVIAKPVNLTAAAAGYSKIKAGKADPSTIEAYNRQTRIAVDQLTSPFVSKSFRTTLRTESGNLPVTVDPSGIKNYDRVDRIEIADTVIIRDGIDRAYESPGAGIPLAARIVRTEDDPLIPEAGTWIPLTALLESRDGNPTIKLIDTADPHSSSPFPVAANFSAPIARDLNSRQREFQKVEALLNFDKFEPYMGIKRIFDFHPDKIPVVLVHGMLSECTTWANALNEMMRDPVIRDRYEFWIYGFPTGAPIPYLSQKLREDVETMYRYRRDHGSTTTDVTVIGHSMGGLMAKTLTQTSGDSQWQRFFEVSPEQLDVSTEDKAALREMFYFKPLPYVNRVIFVATPHLGAEAADRSYANFAAQLIRSPKTLVMATQNVLHQGFHALTPLGVDIHHDFPNSIEQMKFGSELGAIFSDIPLNPSVRYHSIIGSQNGLDIPKEEMTDGVLTYTSAHLDGIPETIVESSHGVIRNPDGMAEIIRLLKSSR